MVHTLRWPGEDLEKIWGNALGVLTDPRNCWWEEVVLHVWKKEGRPLKIHSHRVI